MAVTTQTKNLFLFLALFIILAAPAVALDTHLNITLHETVYQNVTFAQDFDLEEEQQAILIEGVVTVQNPGPETVNDVNVRFDTIENLATDFIHRASEGREGFQTIYPDEENNFNITQTITQGTPITLPEDLDEDRANDTVTHNNTHLIFELSSEYEEFSIPFSNGTNPVNLQNAPVDLDMDFEIVSSRQDNSYNQNRSFARVIITGTVDTAETLDPAEVTIAIQDYERDYAVVYVPELRPGNHSVFDYNVSAAIPAPLNLTMQYTNDEFETKVLTGERFGIFLEANNIATSGEDIENVNITMRAEDVTVENGSAAETFNFTLHNLSENLTTSGDYLNVDNSSNRTWYWTVNSGTMVQGDNYNISFYMQAPDTVASSGTHLAMTQILAYSVPQTTSELRIDDVRAQAAIRFNESKRIVSPQDEEDNRNVTWGSDPNVGTDLNINYTLEKVSLWVTEVRDPNQRVGIETTYYPNQTIAQDETWQGDRWYFNFTDGSTADAPPPIIWMKPYWIIQNTGDQIVNSSITVNGTDLYMNYVYVVGGYWLEVDKQVIDTGDGTFDIFTEVINRGNGHTPQNMTVTVYDFIPDNFDAHSWSSPPNNQSQVSGEFTGTAYQWDVGLRTNLSTSFSPRGSADGLDTYSLNYSVNGTGDFQVSDLYIVGLDPRLVDGANTFEGVSVISAIASTSREVLYLAIVVFLIGINLANFLMTSRINRKLGN